MGSVFVIVADVLAHESLEMPLVEHDAVIQQIPSAVANPAFGDAILPWAAITRSLW